MKFMEGIEVGWMKISEKSFIIIRRALKIMSEMSSHMQMRGAKRNDRQEKNLGNINMNTHSSVREE